MSWQEQGLDQLQITTDRKIETGDLVSDLYQIPFSDADYERTGYERPSVLDTGHHAYWHYWLVQPPFVQVLYCRDDVWLPKDAKRRDQALKNGEAYWSQQQINTLRRKLKKQVREANSKGPAILKGSVPSNLKEMSDEEAELFGLEVPVLLDDGTPAFRWFMSTKGRIYCRWAEFSDGWIPRYARIRYDALLRKLETGISLEELRDPEKNPGVWETINSMRSKVGSEREREREIQQKQLRDGFAKLAAEGPAEHPLLNGYLGLDQRARA